MSHASDRVGGREVGAQPDGEDATATRRTSDTSTPMSDAFLGQGNSTVKNMHMSNGISLLILSTVICASGCKKTLPDERPDLKLQPHPHPHYKVTGHPQRVIVFIHGIFGDSETTWSYSPTVNWPSLLMTDKDSALQNTDIYLAGYKTPYFGNSMSIDDVGIKPPKPHGR